MAKRAVAGNKKQPNTEAKKKAAATEEAKKVAEEKETKLVIVEKITSWEDNKKFSDAWGEVEPVTVNSCFTIHNPSNNSNIANIIEALGEYSDDHPFKITGKCKL